MLRTYLSRVETLVRTRWPLLLLVAGAVAVTMRGLWFMRVLALVLVVLVALTVLLGAGLALYDHFAATNHEPRFLAHLAARAAQARERLSALAAEERTIEEKVAQLKRLDSGATGKQWGKSLALLRGYEEELALRHTKSDFYRQSLRSLRELDQKWRQERHLNALQRDLERLRSPNPAETQGMRALREELTQEQALLATYQQLSKRLDRAETLEGARGLRRDLDGLLG